MDFKNSGNNSGKKEEVSNDLLLKNPGLCGLNQQRPGFFQACEKLI